MTVQFLTGTMVACPRQLLGRSHLPYTLVTGDLNLVPKNWSKSEVHSPDLYEDVCKINSLTGKSCYGGEKHQNPVGFYSRNSTESTLQHKHNNHEHHHHGGAVCPSFGVGSMDPPDRTRVTSSKGVGRGGGRSVLIKSINF